MIKIEPDERDLLLDLLYEEYNDLRYDTEVSTKEEEKWKIEQLRILNEIIMKLENMYDQEEK